MISKQHKKDFRRWGTEKIQTDASVFLGMVHEREIWWCKLGVNIGHEEDGKNDVFERPVLVIKKWSNETVVVLPLTTKIKKNRFHYIFTHDGVEFGVILSQIRLISTKRLTRRIRKIGKGLFRNIVEKFVDLLFSQNERSPAKAGVS